MRTWKRVALWTALVAACIIGGWAWKNARSAPASFDIAVVGYGEEVWREWHPEWLGLQMPPCRLYRERHTPCDQLWGLDTRTGRWGMVWRQEWTRAMPAEPTYCPATRELLWWGPPENSILLAMPLSGGPLRKVYEMPPATMGIGPVSVHPSSPKVLVGEARFNDAENSMISALLEINLTTGEPREIFSVSEWAVTESIYSPSGDSALVQVSRDAGANAGGEILEYSRWYHWSLDGSSEPALVFDPAKPDLNAIIAWAPGPEPVVVYQVYAAPDWDEDYRALAGNAGMKLWSRRLGDKKATLAVDSAEPARLHTVGPTGIAVASNSDGLILWPWGDWEARKTVRFSYKELRMHRADWDGDRVLGQFIPVGGGPDATRLICVDGRTGELKEWEVPCEDVDVAVWVPRP